MTKTVKEIVAEIKETLDKKGGLKHVYFVACGGSKAAIFPGTLPAAERGKDLQRHHLHHQQ